MNICSHVHMFFCIEWSEKRMFGKIKQTQRINLLQKSIDKLTQMLQEMNIHDSLYILCSK